MRDTLIRLLGWRALFLHGDPLVFDRFLWIRRHLGSLPAGDRREVTMDAGCGNGGFAIYAGILGQHVLGVSDAQHELTDARRRAAIVGVQNVRFEVHDLRQLDEFWERDVLYDNVICLEVIEHVLDDAGLLRSIARRMKVGGRLLLTTPTAEHAPLFLEARHQSEVEDGRHVRFGYSPAELRSVIEDAGFVVQQLEGVGGIAMQKVTSLGRRLGRTNRGLAWGLTLPLRALRLVDPALTRATGAAHLSYGIVATKLGHSDSRRID